MSNPLDLHFSKALNELVAKLMGIRDDPDFGNGETQHDLPVLALDIGQVDIGQDAVLARPWQGDGESQGGSWSRGESLIGSLRALEIKFL